MAERRNCLEGTRGEVLEDIRDWNHTNSEHAKPVYCIKDVAGAGKSTIAYTMANEWGKGECFVFFSEDYSKREAQTLCKSLARQILESCHGPGWAEHWGRAPSGLSSSMTKPNDLWEKLVAEPLGKCTVHKHHVLIVNALDQCDTETRGKLLECMLHTSSSGPSPQLRILLTTRSQEDICGILEQETYRDGIIYRSLLDSKSSLEDVRRYVEDYWKDSKYDEISETQRKSFVERCQGRFIFASAVCKELEYAMKDEKSATLEKILQEFTSLDKVYHQALSQAKKAFGRSSGRLKDVLRVILVAQEALSISAIVHILSIPDELSKALFNRLGGVIASGTVDQPVSFLHATLTEFLLRPYWVDTNDNEGDMEEKERKNNYHITEAEGHRVMLKGCLLNVMAKQLRFNICYLETSYLLNDQFEDMGDRVKQWISPGLRYSCHQWANHLQSVSFDPEIFGYLQYFMNNKFLFWLEVLSITRRVNLASSMLSLLVKWIQVRFRSCWFVI